MSNNAICVNNIITCLIMTRFNNEGKQVILKLYYDNMSMIKDGGEGRLPGKGRYRCVASTKARPGKIFPKHLMPGQKVALKPNDKASFHEL